MTNDFFIGPAVVVDDKIDQPDTGMVSVLEQIAAESMPIVKRTELPPDAEIRHWRGFSLIVLDWELNPVDPGIAGIATPEGLSEQNAVEVAAFVEKLLKSLYCPIFILTNESVEAIRAELAARLDVDEAQLEPRILVRSKTAVADGLFDELDEWVRTHPAVYALKRWELGYEAARREMFADFELASSQWPRILWSTSKTDDVNPNFELTETISRNILHRFEPLVFDSAVLEAEAPEDDSAIALRRVVHRNAVVAGKALHADVIMPGDFFAVDATDDSQSKILINVTAACDLVPRGDTTLDTLEMTLLEGSLLSVDEYDTNKKRERIVDRPMPGSEVIWVLREDARPYRVAFRNPRRETWGEHKDARVGRLLEPYITLLQQRFALHFQRQGVPRLPEGYYAQGDS